MKRVPYLALLTVFVIALTAVAVACDGGQTATTSSPTGTGSTATTQTSPTNPHEVEITEENGFTPKVLTVPAGTKVTWYNKSVRRWWISSATKVPDTGLIATGNRAGYTFTQPGTYEYFDFYNKEITGTIIVQ
jgi:plastocyanin